MDKLVTMPEELEELKIKASIWMGKRTALEFFEKRLGKVNKHVIDYRLEVQKTDRELNELRTKFEKTEYFAELLKKI